MQTGYIIVFRILARTNKSTTEKFCREFYGYTDRSNKGKYTYKRHGFLEQFPYIKPLRGVFVVRKEDAPLILTFLDRYNAEMYYREIILKDEDLDILYPKRNGNASKRKP